MASTEIYANQCGFYLYHDYSYAHFFHKIFGFELVLRKYWVVLHIADTLLLSFQDAHYEQLISMVKVILIAFCS